jgi:uncharacterized membrane protein
MGNYIWPVLALLVAAGSWVAIRVAIGWDRLDRSMSDALASLDLRDESEADA